MAQINHLPSPALTLALDLPATEAFRWIEETQSLVDCYKIPLFLLPEIQKIAEKIQHYGRLLFLDLKLHDIPNTVEHQMKYFGQWAPALVSVHISGGREMVRACLRASPSGTQPAGVVLLTSIASETTSEWFGMPFPELLTHWAMAGWEEGLRCFIVSAGDLPLLRTVLPGKAYWICPGIRPEGMDKGDHQRMATPTTAYMLGADMLVMGRGIINHSRPLSALEEIRKRFFQ